MIAEDEFRTGFGEDLQRVLDLDTWTIGADLSEIYRRISEEVQTAVDQEDAACAAIREEIFPRLARRPQAPKGAGVYRAALADLKRIHGGLLFNGGVEACDATIQACDTLPLTIFQIGVCLVSYLGNQGTWAQRLFRRDLRARDGDPVDVVYDLLEHRARRDGLNNRHSRDQLSRLARRGIMSYAERAILLRESAATWRLGHGNPAPFELLTGSGSTELMIAATRLIREMVEDQQKFVFVASEPSDRVLLSIGQALQPLEYAIVSTLQDEIERTVETVTFPTSIAADTTWDGLRLSPYQWIRQFRDVVGPRVVAGVYRATRLAPAHVFYAHVDHADIAAHIALADSLLQEHRGFPLLIDLADTVCQGMFGRETLEGPVRAAYADAGVPWRYMSERASRYL
jgi:hypothetical protein